MNKLKEVYTKFNIYFENDFKSMIHKMLFPMYCVTLAFLLVLATSYFIVDFSSNDIVIFLGLTVFAAWVAAITSFIAMWMYDVKPFFEQIEKEKELEQTRLKWNNLLEKFNETN